jgi:branched-chain amino acid transport system ATP-binding protein
VLDVKLLSSGYGRLPVLHDITFAVAPGEIVLIAGENGAGKSTLLRTIAGFIRPTSGAVVVGTTNVTGWPPEKVARSGMRLVLDGHRIFPRSSVLDNLRLGAAVRRDKRAFKDALDTIYEVFPILQERALSKALQLSGGQQQMLALAQAFLAQPKILLCDEPSLGLAQALLPPILEFLRAWARSGTAVVIVEQHIQIALPVVDRLILMERGRIKSVEAIRQLHSNTATPTPAFGLEGDIERRDIQ